MRLMNLPTLNRCLLPFKQPLDQLGMKGTNRLRTRALNYQELIIRSTVPGGGVHPRRSPLVPFSLVGGRWAAAECRGENVCVCMCARVRVCMCKGTRVHLSTRASVSVVPVCCPVCVLLFWVHTQCWVCAVCMHVGCIYRLGCRFFVL